MSTATLDALDFAPAILAIQDKPPAPLPRIMLYALAALFSILLVWALIGKVDVIATAEGKLVPQSYLKIVQPADSGILQAILVKEGDAVIAGQVLMRMDTQVAQADTKILEAERQSKQLQLRQIDAELANQPLLMNKGDAATTFRQIEAQYQSHRLAYLDAQAQEQALLAKANDDYQAAIQVKEKLRRTLPAFQEQEAAWDKLQKEGYAGRLMALDKHRERIEREQDLQAQVSTANSLKAAIQNSEKRLAQISSNYKQQLHNERVEAQSQLDKVSQELAKQQHKNTQLELKAPQAGIIKDLATHTLGTVVSPGTILMTLVPVNEPLQAEVQIKNEDVGFVHEGQTVKVKLAAYPFQKYGMVEGKIIHVGADANDGQGTQNQNRSGSADQANSQQLPSTYKAIVTLDKQNLETGGKRFQITPGMQVVAEINQGTRTVMEYLLSPVQGVFQEAGRER